MLKNARMGEAKLVTTIATTAMVQIRIKIVVFKFFMPADLLKIIQGHMREMLSIALICRALSLQ